MRLRRGAVLISVHIIIANIYFRTAEIYEMLHNSHQMIFSGITNGEDYQIMTMERTLKKNARFKTVHGPRNINPKYKPRNINIRRKYVGKSSSILPN